MAQSQSWSSRNTSRNSIRSSEEEALRARAEQEKQLRDAERRERLEGLQDYKEKFKQANKYLAVDSGILSRRFVSLEIRARKRLAMRV